MPRPNGPGTAAHVRAWAHYVYDVGNRPYDVGSRGLLPANVIRDYNAAHPGTPYIPPTRETRKDHA